jgi:proline utilization trans-activator
MTSEKPILASSTSSSSQKFGSQVTSLLAARCSTSPQQSTTTPRDGEHVVTPHLSEQSSPHASGWPSEEEAHKLLEIVLLYIGISQYPFDARVISDYLTLLYQDPKDGKQLDCLRFAEVMLVFALGRLLRGECEDETRFPGASFFLEATKRIPDLSTLRNEGTLEVETLGLMALYLQGSDLKDDAYIYVSFTVLNSAN